MKRFVILIIDKLNSAEKRCGNFSNNSMKLVILTTVKNSIGPLVPTLSKCHLPPSINFPKTVLLFINRRASSKFVGIRKRLDFCSET